ncbi:class I SAM-dependent methyltransferase [Phenylobacterium sp.]|uniref:class I SAM-dependent methyltransferase n=1 Tax=Phenylobacterium sp. TaxID=1871053 RepID=UPI002731B2D1|nr:class I SAM-dependent methyltransferase [Phenylobacterium sp.]MDP1618799.1 class I SAM-dependent methyltransferase [Phenylobacterium sp.]MDP1988669.1 class I SAM-dependent methyltransferase [Phenylobacterium sp.]
MQTLGLAGGERVLDVGCGVGGTPTALAQAVGPSGRVMGLELLPAAVEAARRTEGLPANVSFECGDAQTFPLNPGAFDAIFSRFGMMFFARPADALSNLR